MAAVVEADDGTVIRSNLLVEPDPSQIALPMPVRLATYSVGADSSGAVCVAFGFSPSEPQTEHERGRAPEDTPEGVT